MKNISKLLKTFTLLLFVSPSLLLGSSCEVDNRISIGTRPMNPDAIAQIQEELRNSEDCNEVDAAMDYAPKEDARCGFIFDRYPPVYYPSSVHWLAAVSALGDSVEIEDGSVWKINSYDSFKALNWHGNEPLVITQNHRWFSSYNYRLINKNTGSTLEVNLFLGPVKNGEYTRYIVPSSPVISGDILVDIDGNVLAPFNPNSGLIMLSDNTHWELDPSDSSIYRDWAFNDAIIIGSNTGRHSDRYECILINVNMNNHVRAKQY
ncbi:MAG: hypothetical protein V4487_00765 [Chlamydiota bacterium]